MYCLKCKESFEDGSRRFCPTDGARLVMETANAAGRQSEGGIFANLIPKLKTGNDLDEGFSDMPQFVVTEPKSVEKASETDDLVGPVFEIDDAELENILDPIDEIPAKKTKAKRPARKVKPFEIPAGLVELGGRDQLALSSADFRASDPESFVGRTVKGRYYVTEFLGGEDGSFAFLADDKIIRDKMVLVRILLDQENDELARNIFDDELVALSHISHPNIARLIDSGQFKDRKRFLISEYIDALSVYDILAIHGTIDAVRAARVIKQIAYALNEVHQEGIIHRDLRPENIIVASGEGETAHARLVNFGASNGEPNERNRGYKAPEVFDGRLSTISGDIFSLAVVAYEMLTGVLPFETTTENAVVRSQYAGLELLPTKIRPELPTAVDRVLEKALSFDPSERSVKARDFGDAFYAALAETTAKAKTATKKAGSQATAAGEPAWKNRSPEPPKEANNRSRFMIGGLLALFALLAFGLYYNVKQPSELTNPPQNASQSNGQPATGETQMPPLPRNVPQPSNTTFYQNTRQNLKGDLIRNFVGFKMYYPKDWKVNGPQEGGTANTRGKFLDISRLTPEGRLQEQMLVSYYPSKGTFNDDADKFPQMVKETNDTLKKLLPSYQMVSEGEIKVNGDWRAYEVKFHGGGTSESGEKLTVWGRRLFIPAARPGVRNGFEITMLATSEASEVRSVDDIGVRGELAAILYSFEPTQNF